MVQDFEMILQDTLFVKPWQDRKTLRLPGVNPLSWDDWLLEDEAFAAQMAYRDQLLRENRPAVFDADDMALDASKELLEAVLQRLSGDSRYDVTPKSVTRPDGVRIVLNSDHPLAVAGRLVQQDFCVLQKKEEEHVLTGAILCFPSNWRLAEKMGYPLSTIHGPVTSYDSSVEKRVQRIFDGISPQNPVWRANYLLYATANLHQPNREARAGKDTGKFIRVERQSLIKLPRTNAVVFGIHTHVVAIDTVSAEDRETFLSAWETSHHYEVNAAD